jgi:hypothetical protein
MDFSKNYENRENKTKTLMNTKYDTIETVAKLIEPIH